MSTDNISELEERLNSVMYNMYDRMQTMEKRHDATSWLLRHTMQKLYSAEEEIKRQGNQIASLKKKLKEASGNK
jgi:hypothetical protein